MGFERNEHLYIMTLHHLSHLPLGLPVMAHTLFGWQEYSTPYGNDLDQGMRKHKTTSPCRHGGERGADSQVALSANAEARN